MATLLETRSLSKRFASQIAIADIDISVEAGECIAFVGENGAGKSTLAKCLAGVFSPDSGEMLLDGDVVRFRSPRDALQRGVALLPQELAYVPEMSVAQNVLIGQWPNRLGIVDRVQEQSRAAELFERLGVPIDVTLPLSRLRLAERQLVEISKALCRKAKLLILDEPTASLTDVESRTLVEVLHRLSSEGVALVLISHRMDEVASFSTKMHILRNGRLVAVVDPRQTSRDEIISHMLGQSIGVLSSRRRNRDGDANEALRLENISVAGIAPLHDVSLALREGELVGVFGLRGSGVERLGDLFSGRALPRGKRPQGKIYIRGHLLNMPARPWDLAKAGVAYVPAERKREGLVLGMSVKDNITLPVFRQMARWRLWPNRPAEENLAKRLAQECDIRIKTLDQPIGSLSGGNQQKALVASRLAQRPRVLILCAPSRGVDVGARQELHRLLQEIADQGMAALVISSDLEEVVQISDRVIVLRDGMIAAVLSGAEKTQESVLAVATGADQVQPEGSPYVNR